jgi:hypothetical protein
MAPCFNRWNEVPFKWVSDRPNRASALHELAHYWHFDQIHADPQHSLRCESYDCYEFVATALTADTVNASPKLQNVQGRWGMFLLNAETRFTLDSHYPLMTPEEQQRIPAALGDYLVAMELQALP